MLFALSALFPMYLNTFAGIRGVDGKLGELGQVLGLRRSELVRHIVLPGALPAALTGLQLSVVFGSRSWSASRSTPPAVSAS